MADYPICEIKDCANPAERKGMCNLHYQRFKRCGDPLSGKPVKKTHFKKCSVSVCGNLARTKGMCSSHYMRQSRHGDPLKGGLGNGTLFKWIVANKHYEGDECLSWPFSRNTNGYGYASMDGKLAPASRIMCIVAHGPPPSEGMHAAHSCGKGHEGCVNPKHLRWATPLENAGDRELHGTLSRAEAHPSSKLTKDQILEIRDSPKSKAELANHYGVSRVTIWRIKQPGHWVWKE